MAEESLRAACISEAALDASQHAHIFKFAHAWEESKVPADGGKHHLESRERRKKHPGKDIGAVTL